MFLNTLVPLMRGLSSLDIKITPDGANLRIAVIPVLTGVQHETQDATLADLQALLSRPFVFTAVATDDLDQRACEAMRGLAATRSPALDALGDYRAALDAVAESARLAAADKAKSAKPAPTAPAKRTASAPTAPAASPSQSTTPRESTDSTDAAEAPTPASKGASLAADLFA